MLHFSQRHSITIPDFSKRLRLAEKSNVWDYPKDEANRGFPISKQIQMITD